MIRVGIELNHVIRNINKQILKYYQKDIDPSLDLDEIDEKDDVFKYAKFDSLTEKNEFIYIDYPYEIYACAKTMSKDLPSLINNWLSELTNYEEDDVEISFFSLDEEALTIQSSFFFLSKIGTRVRKIIFPKQISEMDGEYDVLITSNKQVINHFAEDENVYTVYIPSGSEGDISKYDKEYERLDDLINDENFLSNIQEFVNNKLDKESKNGESN